MGWDQMTENLETYDIGFEEKTSCTFFDTLEKKSKNNFRLKSDHYNYSVSFKLGSAAVFGTAAYWIFQWHSDPKELHPTGRSLTNETLYCMLGGYGITGELSNAYYLKIISKFHDLTKLNESLLEKELIEPVDIGGRPLRYRYPKQKAKQISHALKHLFMEDLTHLDPLEMRKELMKISGIGPKTASWIVRNYSGSESVAIIDIHLHRAGILAGFFKESWIPAKHYEVMEDAFLKFAESFKISPGGLDLLMWNHMRIR